MSRLKAEAACHLAFKSSQRHRPLDLQHQCFDLCHCLLLWVPESAHQRRKTLEEPLIRSQCQPDQNSLYFCSSFVTWCLMLVLFMYH